MKKFLLAAIIVLIVFWVGTLVFIPNPLTVSVVGSIKAPPAKVNSIVLDTANWHKWWPGEQAKKYEYSVLAQTAFSTRLLAQNGSDTFTSELLVLPATLDSAIVQWTTQQPASINPFTRIQQYNRAAGIKQHFQLLLDSLTAYMQNSKKVYGIDIAITQFKNPFMISMQGQFLHYPSVDEVYGMVSKLRDYAQVGAAAAADSPMVNIDGTGDRYLLRVALPINKKLEAGKDIDFKQMVLGNTLLGTITGGQHTVEKSLLSMQDFVSDHHLTSPAIPFQIWQTNRQQQPDSTRWVTKLYYPVF